MHFYFHVRDKCLGWFWLMFNVNTHQCHIKTCPHSLENPRTFRAFITVNRKQCPTVDSNYSCESEISNFATKVKKLNGLFYFWNRRSSIKFSCLLSKQQWSSSDSLPSISKNPYVIYCGLPNHKAFHKWFENSAIRVGQLDLYVRNIMRVMYM